MNERTPSPFPDGRDGGPESFGRLALYTWAALAAMSSVVALSVVVGSPTREEIRIAEQAQDIENSTVASETIVPAVEIDPVSTASVESEKPISKPPVAAPIVRYGGEIGRDISISQLINRYSTLEDRAPEIFAGLEPLIRFDESPDSLEAALVAGPFEQEEDAQLFCRTLNLELTLPCNATPYVGETFRSE